MSYSRGFLNKRVVIWNPERTESDYGGATVAYMPTCSIWANADYAHGKRAMNNGQIDIYQSIMVRCDCNKLLTYRSRLEIGGRYYVIDSYNQDEAKNEVQMTCFEVEDINKVITQS